MHAIRLACALGAAALLSGCASLPFFGKDEEPNKASEPVHAEGVTLRSRSPATSVGDERELKLAKLWARVDELEEEQYRQKERLRIVEKGLTLGLVPEELKHPGHASAVRSPPSPPTNEGPPAAAAPEAAATPEGPAGPKEAEEHKKEAKAEPGAAPGLSKDDSEKYQTMLANAQDHYRAGRYGRAIIEYSDIGKQFGDKVGEGMHLYWIAKCWMSLKEYNTAYQHLSEFLKEHPTSPWAPRAKLELARAEWQLDHRESANQLLRDIIEQYPNADAAEMAKMELENRDKNL